MLFINRTDNKLVFGFLDDCLFTSNIPKWCFSSAIYRHLTSTCTFEFDSVVFPAFYIAFLTVHFSLFGYTPDQRLSCTDTLVLRQGYTQSR